MTAETVKAALLVAIEQAEHKPGEWAQTVQSMGGICRPGEPFQIGKPWAKEQPWAQFSYKRDSWLAVAAVNAVPALLAEIEALRTDAERYRGVRRVANCQGFTDEQFDQQTDIRVANFDSAMAKERSH